MGERPKQQQHLNTARPSLLAGTLLRPKTAQSIHSDAPPAVEHLFRLWLETKQRDKAIKFSTGWVGVRDDTLRLLMNSKHSLATAELCGTQPSSQPAKLFLMSFPAFNLHINLNRTNSVPSVGFARAQAQSHPKHIIHLPRSGARWLAWHFFFFCCCWGYWHSHPD